MISGATYYVMNGGISPSGYTNKYNADANTISISEGGNSCGFVNMNTEKFWSGGHNYTLNSPSVDSYFLFSLLKYKEKEIMALRVGSGLPNIQKSALENFAVHITRNANEQIKIGSFLRKLDDFISLQRQKVELLKKYKRGVIERMITELTMDCDLRKISSFAKCVAGATPDTKNHEYWDNGTIPWLSSGEVNKKRITSTDKFITPLGYQKTSTKMLPIKTVIIALAGQGKTRGTVAITEKEVCTNQSLAGIITDNTVDSEYLFYYLETQYDNLRILSSGDGTRGGLNLQLINDYLVPTPSLDKQKFIATFGTLIDKNISGNENLLNQLQLMRSAMLQQLFV